MLPERIEALSFDDTPLLLYPFWPVGRVFLPLAQRLGDVEEEFLKVFKRVEAW